MRSYIALIKIRFLGLLQYRAAAFAGVATQIFWGFIRMMIFQGFYASTSHAIPMSVHETITYIWLGQAFFLMVPWNPDREMAGVIRTGNVAYEIIRPLDFYWHWFAKTMAFRTAPVLIRSIPLIIIAIPFLGMGVPPHVLSLGAFLISLAFAVVLSSAFTLLTTITLFWTISGEGIHRLVPSIILIFSGIIIPLPLFPGWFQFINMILPFRGIIDSPFRLYIGHIPYTGLPAVCAHQLIWIIILIIAGRFLVSRGLKRVVIQGG
jgi:ABC-2 type transport system permease protein